MLHSNPESVAALLAARPGALLEQAKARSLGGLPEIRSGEGSAENDLRIEARDAIEEAHSAIGLARVATSAQPDSARVDAMLLCVQNDLFDLSVDLRLIPWEADAGAEAPRIVQSQVDRLARKIEELKAELSPLPSFVLPGGSAAAAALHLARAVSRRGERLLLDLANAKGEEVGKPALKYVNLLSDFLFVAARYLNRKGDGDNLWVPGSNREITIILDRIDPKS